MPKEQNVVGKWIPGLDFIRCTAVFLVLIGHAKVMLPDASREIFKYIFPMPASWGVELFFSLSGYLIGSKWISAQTQDKNRPIKNVWIFMRNRWLRTIPTYWMYLIILLALGLITIQSAELSKNLISNLTLTNWLTSSDYALPVSWTLEIEELSYLLIGVSILIAQPLTRKYEEKKMRYKLLIMPCLLVLAGITLRLINVHYGNHQYLSTHPILRIDALAYGIILACCLKRSKIQKISKDICMVRITIPILILVTFALQFYRCSMLIDSKLLFEKDASVFALVVIPSLGIITTLWVLACCSWRGTGIKMCDNAIKYLAKISYSVYLIHIPIRSYMKSQWLARTTQDGLLLFFAYITASIFLGAIGYYILEKPFLKVKKAIEGV